MDITLGPFKNAAAVTVTKLDPLVKAMHDQAFDTATKKKFDPKEPPDGKPAPSGFTISGKIKSVTKDGHKTQVTAGFDVWIDGTFANAPVTVPPGNGEGAPTEDIVAALTENAITKILALIKAGSIRKAR